METRGYRVGSFIYYGGEQHKVLSFMYCLSSKCSWVLITGNSFPFFNQYKGTWYNLGEKGEHISRCKVSSTLEEGTWVKWVECTEVSSFNISDKILEKEMKIIEKEIFNKW